MDVSLAGQLLSFAAAAVVGAVLGVVYDALALLALKLRFTAVRVLFDVLFWLAALIAIIWFAMTLGGGELRLYALLGVILGGTLYFLTLTHAARAVIGLALDLVFRLLALCFSPVAAFFKGTNKFWRFLTNLFHFLKKRDILYQRAGDSLMARERMYKRGDGFEEAKEAKVYHYYRNRNLLRLRGDKLDKLAAPNQRTARADRDTERGSEGYAERKHRFTSSYRL